MVLFLFYGHLVDHQSLKKKEMGKNCEINNHFFDFAEMCGWKMTGIQKSLKMNGFLKSTMRFLLYVLGYFLKFARCIVDI